MLDETEDDQLRNRAIETVLRQGDRQDLVRLIHLLARGQSGRRITGLIRDCVDQFYSVFLETGPQAWGPIERRGLLGREQLDAAIAALRAVPLPADRHWSNAHEAALAAICENDWIEFVSKGIAAKVLGGETEFQRKPIEPQVAAAYRPLIEHAAALECRILSDQLAATYDLLSRFHAAYTRLKRGAGGLTFDDITLRLADEIAGRHADGLAFRLDARLDHLLLDEFQDTSLHQWRVLEPLAKAVVDGDQSSFFCVGDVKQAIYGWRGGVAEIFNTVRNRLSGLGEQSLNESFRSSQPVIAAVNRVFSPQNTYPMLEDDGPVIMEWLSGFPEHSTHRVDLPGYVCLRTTGDPDPNEQPDDAVLRHAAGYVAHLLETVPEPLTIGILVRTNDAVAHVIASLRERGVVASDEGGNRLDDSAAVQLVLSAMRLADHPGDGIARFHVANSPLGPALELSADSDDDQADDVARALRRRLLEDGYGAVLDDWLRILAPSCDARELNRLRQLVVLGDEYQSIATLRPADFVGYVSAQRVEDPRAARVRVMTVHKAKGLEFDVVVLPHLDTDLVRWPPFVTRRDDAGSAPTRVCHYRNQAIQQLLPSELQTAFRQTQARQLREAMCLLYVAITRAVHALHMLVAPNPKRQKTYATIVRSALAPGQPTSAGSLLYETGDVDWTRRLPAAASHATDARGASGRSTGALRLAPMPDGRRRSREFLAPSHHRPHRALRISDVIRATDSRNLERGSLLHGWFEHVGWLDEGVPDDAHLLRIARRLGLHGRFVADCLAEFQALLQQSVIRNLLSRGSYLRDAASQFAPGVLDTSCACQVVAERRFDLPMDGGLMSGSIDRLVLFERGAKPVAADILDFKSDALRSDAGAQGLVERYRDQLAAYAQAVSAMYSLPRAHVLTRLILLDGPSAVTVQHG
jgi:ATP-dependent exoDNAse (exonuclease V) beta subunit